MAKLTYAEQLRHPNWQRKRLEVMQEADFKCQRCGDAETMLAVYHKRYIKGRMAWEYENDQLAVLCDPCHETEHINREILNRLLAEGGEDYLPQITGMVGGYLEGFLAIDSDLGRAAHKQREPYFELGVAAAALAYQGADAWRDVVREFVKDNSGCPPTFRHAVEWWDEWEQRGK